MNDDELTQQAADRIADRINGYWKMAAKNLRKTLDEQAARHEEIHQDWLAENRRLRTLLEAESARSKVGS